MRISAPAPVQPADVSANALSAQTGTGDSKRSALSPDNSQYALSSLVNQNLPVSEIAQRLGKSVSAVMRQAVTLGLNLNSKPADSSSMGNSGNPAIGGNIDVIA